MSLLPVAGMKIYIGSTLSDKSTDFVAADFTGANASPDSWVLIDGWETMGPVGDSVADIATTLINRGRTIHQKGTADAGKMSNVFAYIPGDAGQMAAIAAGLASVKNNYTFRIAGSESGVTTPSYIYFIALVMGTPEVGGQANTVRKLSVDLTINSNVVYVAYTP